MKLIIEIFIGVFFFASIISGSYTMMIKVELKSKRLPTLFFITFLSDFKNMRKLMLEETNRSVKAQYSEMYYGAVISSIVGIVAFFGILISGILFLNFS